MKTAARTSAQAANEQFEATYRRAIADGSMRRYSCADALMNGQAAGEFIVLGSLIPTEASCCI